MQQQQSRLQRESDFHNNRFADDQRAALGRYYETARRSQDFHREHVLKVSRDANVLDFGCGTGEMTLRIAKVAKHVTGVDISHVAIEKAKRLALDLQVGNIAFHVMNAETLQFPPETFDVVYGTAILHHLDLHSGYSEIARVLKPGGLAIFWEPMGHNPLINAFRRRTPEMRTVDEHPLLMTDLELAHRFFGKVDITLFHLAEIGGAFVLKGWARRLAITVLRQLDTVLLCKWSPLRSWAWICVILAQK